MRRIRAVLSAFSRYENGRLFSLCWDAPNARSMTSSLSRASRSARCSRMNSSTLTPSIAPSLTIERITLPSKFHRSYISAMWVSILHTHDPSARSCQLSRLTSSVHDRARRRAARTRTPSQEARSPPPAERGGLAFSPLRHALPVPSLASPGLPARLRRLHDLDPAPAPRIVRRAH